MKKDLLVPKSAQSTQKAAKSQKLIAAGIPGQAARTTLNHPSARSRKPSPFSSLLANPARPAPRSAPPRSSPTVKPNRISKVSRAHPRGKKVQGEEKVSLNRPVLASGLATPPSEGHGTRLAAASVPKRQRPKPLTLYLLKRSSHRKSGPTT